MGEGPALVQSALTLYASIVWMGEALSRPFEGKKAYVHVIETSGYNERQATSASVKLSTKGRDKMELRESETGFMWMLRRRVRSWRWRTWATELLSF